MKVLLIFVPCNVYEWKGTKKNKWLFYNAPTLTKMYVLSEYEVVHKT